MTLILIRKKKRLSSVDIADMLGTGARTDNIIKRAFALRTVSFDSAMLVLDRAYTEVEQTGDRLRYGKCKWAEGGILLSNDRPADVLPLLKEALNIANEFERPSMVRALTNLIFSSRYLYMRFYQYGLRLC